MKFSKSFRFSCAIFMSVWMTNAPSIAFAEIASNKLISTQEVVRTLTRAEAETQVKDVLANQKVQEELLKRGLSAEEIEKRIASLNDSELRQLAIQMDQARYGGILVEILVVVLIIFLIKRM